MKQPPDRDPDFSETFPDGFYDYYYKVAGGCEAYTFNANKEYIACKTDPPWSSLAVARNNAHWCYHSRQGNKLSDRFEEV